MAVEYFTFLSNKYLYVMFHKIIHKNSRKYPNYNQKLAKEFLKQNNAPDLIFYCKNDELYGTTFYA